MTITGKLLCVVGSLLLFLMAAFHGSGYFFVTETILESNAEDFLKQIVPALFVHPSIHLVGLAVIGVFSLFLAQGARKLLFLLAILVGVDAALGFYLGGVIPGMLLLASALCFVFAGAFSSKISDVGT